MRPRRRSSTDGFFLTHSSCKVIEWTQTDGTDWDHLEVFFPCPAPPPQSQMAANESAPFCQPAHDQLTGTQNPAEVHHLSRSHDIPGRPAFILGHESRNPGEGMGRTAKALAASAAANGKRVVIGVPCNTFHHHDIWQRYSQIAAELPNVTLVHLIDEVTPAPWAKPGARREREPPLRIADRWCPWYAGGDLHQTGCAKPRLSGGTVHHGN